MAANPAPDNPLWGLQDRRSVAQALGVPLRVLTYVLYIARPESYYRTWDIKKKGGGVREIQAPSSTLIALQRDLNTMLQTVYRPKRSTHGFVSGKSVATNARVHLGSAHLLNIDLEEFFDSIHFGRVRGLFLARPFECSKEAATVLAQLCCVRGRLATGAPTSPVISNMIAYRLDKEMQSLARRYGCRYSRYADDLTISCTRDVFPPAIASRDDNLEVHLGDQLIRVVESNDFRINPRKTRLSSRQQRQVVTGVKVNVDLNVDRKYVRRIRAMLHAWDKYGVAGAQDHLARHYSKDRYPGAAPRFTVVLRGRIAYLAMIRGKDDDLAGRFLDQFNNLANRRPINDGIVYRPPVPRLRGARAPETGERRQLLTIMFTDIVRSTDQLAQQGDRTWGQKIDSHFHKVRGSVSRHKGRVIKTIGDGTLSTFPGVADALRAALDVLRGAGESELVVRVGLHTGEVDRVGDDVEGLAVNVAKRVEEEARPSTILVSLTVQQLVVGDEFKFGRARRHKLKGVPGRWSLTPLRPG